MLYPLYDAHADLMAPLRAAARGTALALEWMAALPTAIAARPGDGHAALAAALRVFSDARLTHARPAFGIDRVDVAGREVAVREVATHATPFGTLLHFAKDGVAGQPRVLVVAPLSGHFATLLRDTVRTMLADHDVFITDWHNARDVPPSAGAFGFDEYVGHLVEFLDRIGPGAHAVAVCQPCVALLAAAAVMASDGHPARPRSLTLIAGPVDGRVNPTRVNRLAMERSIEWFDSHLVCTVPARHAGAGRRVYPGFLQLSAFMSMNLERHLQAFAQMVRGLAAADEAARAQARTTAAFYEEYFAVSDLPAEFYLETVERVFQRFALPAGTLQWKGEPVECGAIRRTALLTVEGEKDDICAPGQTLAAHALCAGIRTWRKQHLLQAGAGHYGVFSGRRWQQQIYPVVRDMIQLADRAPASASG